MNFCKPIPESGSDKLALLKAALSGDPKFFLGTDSASRPLHAKRVVTEDVLGKCAAAIFSQPYATQLMLEALELAVEKKYSDRSKVNEEVLKDVL